ncbi:VCBS domain-containing protein [Massilia sp. B-10]|nr:VCBS domain-containing protein [Massilia sp. B-10]
MAGTIAGTYGSIAIDANGAWNYTASSAHPEFVAGTNYSDFFTVTSADGTTSTITVNILGTNDAAVISTATVNLTETDAVLTASGNLTITDADSAATFAASAPSLAPTAASPSTRTAPGTTPPARHTLNSSA